MDNTICLFQKQFADEEEGASEEFPNKETVEIKKTSVKFNGVKLAIFVDGDRIIIRQPEYINKTENFKIQKDMTFDLF